MAWRASTAKLGVCVHDYTPKAGQERFFCIPVKLGDLVEIVEENGGMRYGLMRRGNLLTPFERSMVPRAPLPAGRPARHLPCQSHHRQGAHNLR